jgi:hypothetical protein
MPFLLLLCLPSFISAYSLAAHFCINVQNLLLILSNPYHASVNLHNSIPYINLFFLNNQPDALIIQIYSVIKLYINFRFSPCIIIVSHFYCPTNALNYTKLRV